MAAIPKGVTSRAGLTVADAAVSNGDTIDLTSGPVVLLLICTTNACTPTFEFGDAIDTVTGSSRDGDECPINTSKIYGPFPDFPYGDTGDLLTINFSTTTGVTAYAFSLGSLQLD